MSRMRLIGAVLFAVMAAAAVRPGAVAAEEIAVKIAIIDVKYILSNAASVKDVQAQMQAYVDAYRSETEQEDLAIRNAESELARKRTIISPEAYAEERRKFEQRLIEARGKVEQRKRSLNVVQADAMRQVQTALNRVVTDIASENSLTLILSKEQTILVAKPLEITNVVLQRLDQVLPSVTLATPGQ